VPTLDDKLIQVKEMEGRIAVLRTCASYLRTRFLTRDSGPAVANMRALDGSPVSEPVIENQVVEFEREAASLEKAVRAARTAEVRDV